MHNSRRLLLLAAIAAILVACGSNFVLGGSSDSKHGGVEVAAVRNPLLAAGKESQESQDYIVKSSDPISKGAPRVVSYPNGRDNDEVSETGAGPVEPCRLVPRSKATAILGEAVQVSEEPLGPTCVYSLKDSAQQVTLVVENTSLESLRRHARKASRVQIGGRVSWCMRYESTSVAVPLAGGDVLHVTGPCDAAARLAARALPRVSP